MKNTKIPIIKGHWCKLRVILLSLLYPCLGYSCSDSASSAIPDDWITISTDSVSFPYEGVRIGARIGHKPDSINFK